MLSYSIHQYLHIVCLRPQLWVVPSCARGYCSAVLVQSWRCGDSGHVVGTTEQKVRGTMGTRVVVSGCTFRLAVKFLVNFTQKLQKSEKNVPMAFQW